MLRSFSNYTAHGEDVANVFWIAGKTLSHAGKTSGEARTFPRADITA
jgi:hypothetical protein